MNTDYRQNYCTSRSCRVSTCPVSGSFAPARTISSHLLCDITAVMRVIYLNQSINQSNNFRWPK